MPLFGRRLFVRNENDSTNDEEQTQSFTIEHTGEKFRDEKLYEKVKQVYELERWTCECTWRSALTHKQAFQSEIETRKSLESIVPSYFHKTIFDIIHQSVKPLEKLAEEISIILGQAFVIGEPVQFKKRKDSTVVKGTIERIEENDEQKKRTSERASAQMRPISDKQLKNVKYGVQLLDEDRVVNNVQPNELQRSSLIPNREKLKTFIRAYAIRLGNRSDSPWIFYDDSIQQKFQLKDRLAEEIVEKFRQTMTISLEEIVREKEKTQRKQDEEKESPVKSKSKSNESELVVSSDDSPRKSNKKSPKKVKKQLTLEEMKFGKVVDKNSSKKDIFEKKSPSKIVPTYKVAVPYSLLQKLDKTRRDRGVDSKLFQRLILHSARTLNEAQRSRLPDEYRSLIEKKFDELELKRRLSEMTEDEKKNFFQNRQKMKKLEKKVQEDLDLNSSKVLPAPKKVESIVELGDESLSDLLVVSTFFSSLQNLFVSSLPDDLSKTNLGFLRSFKHRFFLRANREEFFSNFVEFWQILLKFLLKEDQRRSANDESNSEENESSVADEQRENQQNEDFQKNFDFQLAQIPVTNFTLQELTRLYLVKEKIQLEPKLFEKLSRDETKNLTFLEQIDLLFFLVQLIVTDNEIMSEYFEYLTRNMTETFRERNQLLAERRKVIEQENQQKKLQLQNGDNEHFSNKKINKNQLFPTNNSNSATNDENQQNDVDETNDEEIYNDEDLKTVIQRRRQMLAVSKQLKEKREIQAQKIILEQKREIAIQKAEQVYQEAVLNLQFGFRIKPLGYDRFYSRYWFFKGYAGIFVEKGWIGSEINYSSRSTSVGSPTNSNVEKNIPKDEKNSWLTYDTEESIEELIQALNNRGVREQNLLENLKKIGPLLKSEFEEAKSKTSQEENSGDQTNVVQQNFDIVVALRSDLEDIETRLRHGSLGGFIVNENLVEWQNKLKESDSRSQLADLLIQLQQTVPEKFASGIFGTHEVKGKSSKKKVKVSTENLQIWINDCRNCQTFSRLYVLMMIFENSIAWNKSTVGLKCKVCRRKHKDEFIAVCDQCCQAYHLECLRAYSMDQTKTSINDLWFCPACRPEPVSKRRTARNGSNNKSKTDFYDADIYDVDNETASNASSHERSNNENGQEELSEDPTQSDPENISNQETICSVCAVENSDENELIQCIQCRSFFHCQCHEPPLRCLPRSTTWMCTNCRNGVNNLSNHPTRRQPTRQQNSKTRRSNNQRSNGTRRSARKNYRESNDESDFEEEQRQQRRSKRLRRSSGGEIDYRENKSDDSESFSRSRRRRVRISKSSSSDEEENEISLNDEQSATTADEDENEELNSNDSD